MKNNNQKQHCGRNLCAIEDYAALMYEASQIRSNIDIVELLNNDCTANCKSVMIVTIPGRAITFMRLLISSSESQTVF